MRFPKIGRRHNGIDAEFSEIHSRDELMSLVDREARRLLNISGAEFLELRARGELPERMGVRTLSMLASLEPEL